MNLRIPGPTPLPPQVVQALQRAMINHRGAEFAALAKRITARLQQIFETTNDILILPASGTGGLEAAVVNSLSPGNRVLACIAGSFGVRFAEIAEAFGARVDKLNFPPGSVANPQQVAEKLRGATDYRAVLVTHSETSTGVLNPLQAIAQAVRANSDALVIADAVSSLGATPLATDAWGVDVVITGSQKALMCPPGAALISVGERAWRANEHAKMPRFYWDWREWKKWMTQGQTPFTPALSLYFALDAALDLLLEEGMQNVYARHARLGEMARGGAQALGMRLFPDPRYASPTVTALLPPEKVDANELIRRAREECGVEFAGGQEELRGKIIRIGHLGYVFEADIRDALGTLERVLKREPAVAA